MKMVRIDVAGDTNRAQGYASAEALAQALSPKESLLVDKKWLWSLQEQRLSKDVDVFFLSVGGRVWVARNTSTPATTLAKLATDPNWRVRAEVAKNANSPPTTLAMLTNDPDANVRDWVAMNANTPVSTLATLATDPLWIVRTGVARHASTPAATLTNLANDVNLYVQEAAKKNPNYDPSLPVPRKP